MPPTQLLALAQLGCVVALTGLFAWEHRARVAAEKAAEHWRALAMRKPRKPALTVVAPLYHAPPGMDDD